MAQLLDLDQLRTFLAIADSGSFTQAASNIHRTQSAVSMQMRRLEDKIGKPLFVRDGRNVRLSEDGDKLIPFARRLLRLNDETLAAFNDDELSGRVCIGTPDDYAERFLPEILARFARSNPRVEVCVVCDESDELAKRVRAGELDMAIVTHCEDTMGSEVFRREPLFWIAAKHHDTEADDPLPLALGAPSCTWRKTAMATLEGIDRPYRLVYSSRNTTALMSTVQAGLAVSVIAESALRPGVKILGPAEGFPPLPMCEIGLLRNWHSNSATMEALAGHVVSALGNMPVPDADEALGVAAE
ncbi:LysR substrate-binding domain-containing protein [Rhodobium gokarnense]|uniref:DNA-binding transcriptional LysR family regulator n=1 Tax=Rhodobium gokarnense TaxID=364296 RepID=A0ABT3HCS6_9HYPH|nr:LysR substrate-binding domain-containing protein [Rhodobium gokarnense]MCW2308101.1 DNA-binding transcriptional LysR family regulator [Rhodobium gokarnense]